MRYKLKKAIRMGGFTLFNKLFRMILSKAIIYKKNIKIRFLVLPFIVLSLVFIIFSDKNGSDSVNVTSDEILSFHSEDNDVSSIKENYTGILAQSDQTTYDTAKEILTNDDTEQKANSLIETFEVSKENELLAVEAPETTSVASNVATPSKPPAKKIKDLKVANVTLPVIKPLSIQANKAPELIAVEHDKDEEKTKISTLEVKSLSDIFASKDKKIKMDEEQLLANMKEANSQPTSENGIALPLRKPLTNKEVKQLFTKLFDKNDRSNSDTITKPADIKSGDTLMNILIEQANLDRKQAYNAIEVLKTSYNPRSLNQKQNIKIYLKPNLSNNAMIFSGMEIQKNAVTSVMLKRLGDNDFITGTVEKEVKKITKTAKGKIKSSLYVSTSNAGIPDYITASFIKALSWTVDFQRDIRPGDKFKVAYEQYVTEDGNKISKRGNLLYASISLRGKPIAIYRHENKDGSVNYYEKDGKAVKKALMKTPIKGARMSSGYGKRRHPISGYTKMHKGIDFAAVRGTPIYAAGDGVIEYLGRNSSFGKYIRIRHRSGLKTAYAHMNGYKSGLRNGHRVKQGQVIGYVGTTGRSTGPHLHYEVIVNGRHVNPRKVKMTQAAPLRGSELKRFKANIYDINAQLKRKTFGIKFAQLN